MTGDILHVGHTCGQPFHYAQGLRRHGVGARNVAWVADPVLRLPFDEAITGVGDSRLAQGAKALRYLATRGLRRVGGYHFHSYTLLYTGGDLPLLAAAGKPMIFTFWGSDVRIERIAKGHNPDIVCPFSDEKRIRSRLAYFSRFTRFAAVADRELSEYIEPYFEKISILPQIVDAGRFPPRYPAPDQKTPVLVHIPTRRAIKGSDHIIAAVDRLRREGHALEFRLLENLPQSAVYDEIARADIVIDEVRSGTYGILAIEAMALGKPVVCYIREDLRATYPPGLPLVSASIGTVHDRLAELVADPGLRQDLGRQGRRYVERNHDVDAVIPVLLGIYREAGFDIDETGTSGRERHGQHRRAD